MAKQYIINHNFTVKQSSVTTPWGGLNDCLGDSCEWFYRVYATHAGLNGGEEFLVKNDHNYESSGMPGEWESGDSVDMYSSKVIHSPISDDERITYLLEYPGHSTNNDPNYVTDGVIAFTLPDEGDLSLRFTLVQWVDSISQEVEIELIDSSGPEIFAESDPDCIALRGITPSVFTDPLSNSCLIPFANSDLTIDDSEITSVSDPAIIGLPSFVTIKGIFNEADALTVPQPPRSIKIKWGDEPRYPCSLRDLNKHNYPFIPLDSENLDYGYETNTINSIDLQCNYYPNLSSREQDSYDGNLTPLESTPDGPLYGSYSFPQIWNSPNDTPDCDDTSHPLGWPHSGFFAEFPKEIYIYATFNYWDSWFGAKYGLPLRVEVDDIDIAGYDIQWIITGPTNGGQYIYCKHDDEICDTDNYDVDDIATDSYDDGKCYKGSVPWIWGIDDQTQMGGVSDYKPDYLDDNDYGMSLAPFARVCNKLSRYQDFGVIKANASSHHWYNLEKPGGGFGNLLYYKPDGSEVGIKDLSNLDGYSLCKDADSYYGSGGTCVDSLYQGDSCPTFDDFIVRTYKGEQPTNKKFIIHQFNIPGDYTVKVRVDDPDGNTYTSDEYIVHVLPLDLQVNILGGTDDVQEFSYATIINDSYTPSLSFNSSTQGVLPNCQNGLPSTSDQVDMMGISFDGLDIGKYVGTGTCFQPWVNLGLTYGWYLNNESLGVGGTFTEGPSWIDFDNQVENQFQLPTLDSGSLTPGRHELELRISHDSFGSQTITAKKYLNVAYPSPTLNTTSLEEYVAGKIDFDINVGGE